MLDSSLCRAAAPRLRPLQLLLPARLHQSVQLLLRSDPGLHPLSAAARRLRPLQLLLLTASVSTASRLRPLRLLLPDCVRFNSAPRWRPLRLLLPDCVRFNCCSPIAFTSAAAPRQLFWKIQGQPCPLFSNIHRGVRGSSTKVVRHYSLVPPHEHPTSVTHKHTHKHTVKILIY